MFDAGVFREKVEEIGRRLSDVELVGRKFGKRAGIYVCAITAITTLTSDNVPSPLDDDDWQKKERCFLELLTKRNLDLA